MLSYDVHADMKPGDIFVTLDDTRLGEGETPLKVELYLKTEDGRKELDGSALLYAKELRLGINLCREHEDPQSIPLEERAEELARYRQAGCVLRKNPDPEDNFYRVEQTGSGTVWICNKGKRSLRFQTADGLLYRVCAGTIQPLDPANTQARIQPSKILLDVDSSGNPVDIQIRAVHVLDGGAWRRGDVYVHCGDYTDSYHLRVQHRDDCLGVFQAYSSYFMGRSALEVLDIDSYGPAQWYIRNLDSAPLTLRRAGGEAASVPADRTVYPLEDLLSRTQFEQEVSLP